MSLQTDAETIRELSNDLVNFEIAKTSATAPGSTVVVSMILVTRADGTRLEFPCENAGIALSASQRQALFAVEAGWQTTIKNIAAAWTP